VGRDDLRHRLRCCLHHSPCSARRPSSAFQDGTVEVTRYPFLRYLSSTRVPRIFWLLSALRKFGTNRSISSK
jgi:hypothetical protein